ncbi:hypothetical protein J1N35_027479 [Gossypium stocksii]|uniref:RNase H type-1 domain-containing protein n=1 Tax=Gossypium stocksii TaxID=47602 RepID=A0A9D3ZZM6_9ROSI|nr:hypothetical protein J1N35_027479 [Gossypium stocksii]
MHRSPRRVNQFLWLVLKGKLLTNVELVKRNITWDPRWPICDQHMKFVAGSLEYLNTHWPALALGWIKINCDTTMHSNSNEASIGGHIRDHYGNWMAGFSGYLGLNSMLRAESHAIWEGLLVAWFRQVIVESDCADAGTLINSSSQASSVLVVVNSIKELCNRQWTV